MRFFGGGNEIGFISIGQHAHGFIAIGQEALGVIAIGQLARGVVAVGQLAVGVIAFGQLAVGIGWATMGIGGSGWVALKLVPQLDAPRDYPPRTTFEAVHAGWGDGWVDAEARVEADQTVGVYAGGRRLPVKIAARLVPRAKAVLASEAGGKVLAHLRHMGHLLVCDRMISVPIPVQQRPGFGKGVVVRTVLLAGVAVGVWAAALHPLLDLLTRLFA